MKKTNLANPHIESLEPYMSARRIGGSGEVWLNANELPFPRQPISLDASEYHRYPDQGPDQVQAAYANYAGLQADQVLALRGADEAIDLLLRGFCKAGEDKIIISSPTYGMYQVCAEIQDADVIDIPLTADYQLDVPAITSVDDVKLIFVCNPNNPTGNSFRREDILAITNHFAGKALVAVDEAYIEFCPQQTVANELNSFDNLVVIRTMSKAFGLAGVHVGYLMANEPVMSTMRKVAAPYPLADPCAQIALQALTQDAVGLMQEQVSQIIQIRTEFCNSIADLPITTAILPSVANFVLVFFSSHEAVWQALTEAGIVARRIPHPRLVESIRFSIGTEREMDRVKEILVGLT